MWNSLFRFPSFYLGIRLYHFLLINLKQNFLFAIIFSYWFSLWQWETMDRILMKPFVRKRGVLRLGRTHLFLAFKFNIY